MPSKKKKLTPLQLEYQKEYKNYLKRIKSAQKAGYYIPEDLIKSKKEKPRTRDIEALKKVTRKSLRESLKTGKVSYIDKETGEFLEGRKAYAKSYYHKRNKAKTPEDFTTEFLVQQAKQARQRYLEWLFSETNSTRPTSFNEYLYIIDKINDYIKTYNPPQSSIEHMIDRRIEQELKTLRGPLFDYSTFKETEKDYGWLYKDPNRPLEKEEIDLLQGMYDQGKTTDPVGLLIEGLRGWNPKFNYYDKYYENQINETGKAPFTLIKDGKEQQYDSSEKRYYGDEVKQERRKESYTAESPYESISLNNLRERINGVELGQSKYSKPEGTHIAESNRYRINEFLDRAIAEKGVEAVDRAIAHANANGQAFQVYFLYKDYQVSFYLSSLENFLMDYGLDYETAEGFDSGYDSEDDYEQ